ncbi:phenylalanine--tRNA ligase subunit beta [Candidatus Zinderia endosymbiont of Aphrophora alni]|uniref:phenylalanine--tRNA ligase subunit beta n=1 Tax=Candidatus Zinderia endosymbiont of Aphrophora alni TaxID=3077951 RepID=UPI0030CB8BBE
MLLSKNWLKTIINLKINSYKLSNLLTMSGIEVEKIEIFKKTNTNLIIGEIIKINRCNNINICKIHINKTNINKIIYIITNNFNIKLGLKTICLKKNKKNLQRKFFSYYEINLLENYNKNIIKLSKNKINGEIYFKKNIKDTIFTLNIPNNRPDCLSINGIAREIATLTNTKIKTKINYKNIINTKDNLKINIINNKLCNRFSGRIIKNLNINNPIPIWMKYRLKISGKKQVSTIIDIINYVTLETGFFFNIIDLDKIKGNLNIDFGKKDEVINLLNKKKIKIKKKIGIISDETKILSLIGVINSKNIIVNNKTKNIYIEAGCWKKKNIKKILNTYNLSTNSSKIFEKKIDYLNIINALERITYLIFNICGTSKTLIGPINDILINKYKQKIIQFKKKKIKKIIGINIENKKIEKIFKKLNITSYKKKNIFYLTPPNYRFDLKIEEDIIEEIARIYGYKNIPSIPPKTINIIELTPKKNIPFTKIRNLIANLDYQEVINYSFTSDKLETDFMKNTKQIKILNPISNKMNVLRSSLIPNLIINIKHNIKYKKNRIRLFEIGTIFKINKNIQNSQYKIKGYKQEKYITCISYGKLFDEQWGVKSRNIDFFDIKSDLENLFIQHKLYFYNTYHPSFHPKYSLKIILNKKKIGFIGIIHPYLQKKYNLKLTPIIFEIKAKAFKKKKKIKYKKISNFPEISRDISFIIDEKIQVQSIFKTFKKIKKINKNFNFIKKIILFDQYKDILIKKNKKSLSFKIIIQGKTENLNSKIINLIINSIIKEISKIYKIKLRNF